MYQQILILFFELSSLKICDCVIFTLYFYHKSLNSIWGLVSSWGLFQPYLDRSSDSELGKAKKMRWSPFFWIPICLALLSFFLFRIFPFNSPHNQPQGVMICFHFYIYHLYRIIIYWILFLTCAFFQKLFTAEELAPYNGTDPQLPILLGILGYCS